MFENYYDGEDPKVVNRFLQGRKIIEVDQHEETLTLDNGQVLKVHPNSGCGGCPNGHFWLNELSDCDNIITRAEVRDSEAEPDEWGDSDEIISIYVYAEGLAPKKVIEVQGNIGNGYYGRGFEIEVRPLTVNVDHP